MKAEQSSLPVEPSRAKTKEGAAPDAAFACSLTDADLVKGCAPEQPEVVQTGQRWMNCTTGDTYPVRHIERGTIYLGSSSYTIILTEDLLRRDYVCTDPPLPVTELHRV